MADASRLGSLLSAVAIGLAGCGGDPAPADGGGPDASVPGIAAPDIPWLVAGEPPVVPPALDTCPPGWRSDVTEGDAPVCDPFDPMGHRACGAGEAHYPGTPGCAPVGRSCPTGDFADDLPADAPVVYVLAAASPGGDGSSSAPHDALTSFSMAALSGGTTIALGRGEYEGPLRLRDGFALRGACAAETRIVGGIPSTDTGIIAPLGAATLEDLTVAPAAQPGIVAPSGGSVTLRGLVVESALRFGLRVRAGATVEGERLVVRDTRGSGGGAGFGVIVSAGGTATLGHAEITGSAGAAILVEGEDGGRPATLSLEDAVVRDTYAISASGDGRGVQAQINADVTLARLFMTGNAGAAVVGVDPGTTVDAEDLVIRDIGYKALSIEYGADAEVRRAHFANVQDRAVHVLEAAALRLSDVVITDPEPRPTTPGSGWGLEITGGGRLEADRLVVERAWTMGLFADTAGTSIAARDLRIVDMHSDNSDGSDGRGVNLQLGATGTFDRMVVERARAGAIFAGSEGTMAAFQDVLVLQTLTDENGTFGKGLVVESLASVEIARAVIAENREGALHATEGTVTATDLVLRDGLGAIDGLDGFGIIAVNGSSLHAERVSVARARGAAVFAQDSEIGLTDLVVDEVRTLACVETTCPEIENATGVMAWAGGRVDVERFDVAGAALCGLYVAMGGALDVRDGLVRQSVIGACIGEDGYDLGRLNDRVRYLDNGVNVQATTLPVPEIGGSTGTWVRP